MFTYRIVSILKERMNCFILICVSKYVERVIELRVRRAPKLVTIFNLSYLLHISIRTLLYFYHQKKKKKNSTRSLFIEVKKYNET